MVLTERKLYPNGVNGASGEYLQGPLALVEAYEFASGARNADPTHTLALRGRHERQSKPDEALAAGLNPRDLAQTGWGVIFPQLGEWQAVYEALQPLFELRREQATQGPQARRSNYREFRGVDAPARDESKYDFLARHGVNVGMPADPEFMPYYLLLVGSPEEISFRFQYELDVEYAVGRVWFETPAEYARYAAAVVGSATGAVKAPRRATLFGVESNNDPATTLSARHLVPPVAQAVRAKLPDWDVAEILSQQASKARLLAELSDAPGLLFTASHGMAFPVGDERHLRDQGALLCADWPGPGSGPIPAHFYLAAADLGAARVGGTVFLHFACFAAGTPAENDYPDQPSTDGIAERPFVAALPRALLAHPGGGALAVIGHVERVWGYSFLNDQERPQVQAFRDTLWQLLQGLPVGAAMEAFNQRYAALATALTGTLATLRRKRKKSEDELARLAALWTDHNDARSYIVLGDPAVHLRFGPRATHSEPVPLTTISTQESPVMAESPLPKKVLEATARRVQEAFGSPGRSEAFDIPLEGTPGQRQETLRRVLEKQSAAERLRSNPPEAIARRLRKLGVPEQEAGRIARERSFALLEGTAGPPRPGLERIIGRNELLGVRYLDGGTNAARAVGRVVVRTAGGTEIGYGTGSLVSPHLFLTNNHVLDSRQRAQPSIVEFNYQLGLDGQFLHTVRFALDPDTFFLTSPEDELDLTLVAVRPLATDGSALAKFGLNPMRVVDAEVLNGESVTIIQHPGGEPKKIALRENRVLKLPNTQDQFLYYETDTTPGSSGAPVFNDQWEVVALHHSGFPAMDAAGNYLTPEGDIWTRAMGEHRIHWIANEGIRVAAILQFLTDATGLTDEQKRLRDTVLNPGSQPQPVVVPGAALPETRVPETAPSTPPVSTITTSAGVVTVTVPLTITVSLGGTNTSSGTVPAVARTTPTPVDAALDEADLRAAKAELARAASRPYYDKPADEASRTAYYQSLSANLTPAQLFDALAALLKATHRTQPRYKPMTEVYPWVDLQQNRKLKSVYSGQEFEPLTLIERDFEVERLRQERLARFQRTEAATVPGREEIEIATLEAALPFNCEHVVPQSWFDKHEPMRGDLHHLFACESGCNSFRGNIAYFDFTNFGEAIRSDCGKREVDKFEPQAGKGAVARATLYFLLRYPRIIDSTGSAFTADRLPGLVGWHKDNPPGDYERHRNQAIFAVQGNRNPLIDFPDWVDRIDFTRGLT